MAKAVKEGNMKFCLDLYKLLTKDEENLFFSPFSISVVMSMVLLGSKKNTAKQLKKCLGFQGINEKNLLVEIEKVLKGIKTVEGDVVLNVANKLFPEASYDLESDFKEKCMKFYGADIKGLDFAGNPDESRLMIHDWAQKETKDKIKNLLPDGSINGLTKLVLANAVYFSGEWKDKFDISDTKTCDFYVNPEMTVTVDMMYQSEGFRVAFDMDVKAQIVELPYHGDSVSMIIILPNDKFGLAEVERSVNKKWLLNIIRKLRYNEIKLSLPRMKLEQEFDLVSTMQKMGIKDVFDENKANLKGMSPQEGLFVSSVAHKAIIEVNEEGSEAAAAAGTDLYLNCLPIMIKCDHPFMFFLMHKPSEVILFCGRFISPQ